MVVWEDARRGWHDLYMQRVDTQGNLKWQSDGLPLSVLTGTNSSHSQNIVHDGSDGGIVVWWTSLGGLSIYSQRIDSLGEFQWGDSGKFVTTGTLYKWERWSFPDNNGGIIFRYRKEGEYCYQRLDSVGNLLWGTTGITVGYNDYRIVVRPICQDRIGVK